MISSKDWHFGQLLHVCNIFEEYRAPAYVLECVRYFAWKKVKLTNISTIELLVLSLYAAQYFIWYRNIYLLTNFWRKSLSNGGLGNRITDEMKSVNAIVKVAIDKQETRNDLLRLM